MIKIIAEIGWNHCGDLDLAKQMAKAAQENGATYAKYQTWSVDRLKPGSWDEDGRRQIYEKAQLSEQDHIDLINYCDKIGIKFLSSVFSLSDAELLVKIGCKEVKIPSFESRNIELIKYCDEHFDVVFMSTGTSKYNEVKYSTLFFKKAKLYLLHCVSSYPCLPSIANIPRMIEFKKLGFSIGYSDHIQGVESAKVAIEFGAEVIEKHFTIDNNLPGRDNKFAILPEELANLTEYVKLRDEMLIDKGLDFQECELDSRNNYTGRFDG